MKIRTVEKKTKEIEFDVEQVEKVYSGKPNECMCGCSGKYYYSGKNAIAGGLSRGYAVTPEEISDKMIAKMMKMFAEYPYEIENIDDYIFTIIVNDRQYTIYLLQ